MSVDIRVGDALSLLSELPSGPVQACVTSPPYWGLRDYGVGGQIGLERTPDEYVAKIVEVFREVRRVLRDDGTLWLNLGDSYARGFGGGSPGEKSKSATNAGSFTDRESRPLPDGLKAKDLVGIPWRVAFALQADGWYLRSDIIWHKPNPMPESVTDRPTKSHEYLFLLSKSDRYFYDAEAVSEPAVYLTRGAAPSGDYSTGSGRNDGSQHLSGGFPVRGTTRNRRSVWTVATQPYRGAHFATFPPKLIEPCILAGSGPGDTVLDPFGGAGTTALVALQHGRKAILTELNPEYIALARKRLETVQPSLGVA